MADICDEAATIEQEHLDRAVSAARNAPFDPGVPGVCGDCGDESPRLVKGSCARCRDLAEREPRRW
ncbi:hypothetical protein S2M10_29580 [Sphingomonas sp. S2M10]|uniref:conjugal transfer protein TraR n=1 Tax=Sphingomonas sp. S2M10 TaxID=2705010 RepID=UPI0014572C87|nr:conjugal transfer protein TraR [Sphingomonas sp. S2M10]NLS27956.1 hypothetical protein [Sphingomonas sp. S2M10]